MARIVTRLSYLAPLAALLSVTVLPMPAAVSQGKGRTIDVYDNHGGSVAAYNARWARLKRQGVKVRIVGPCQSACTILLRHIPRRDICVTPAASFGFHMAKLPDMTKLLWSGYAGDIRGWINQRGGLTPDFKWMSAPDTYRFFKKC